MASNVPKFTSFRPKPKDPPAPVEKSGRPEQPERPEKAASDRPRTSKHVLERPSHAPPRQQSTSYFVDKKGDPAISRYGSLNRYETPSYRRYGYGSILGLSGDLKIDREQSSDRGLVLSGPRSHRRERILTSKHAARETGQALRFVKAAPSLKSANTDFIELSSRKRKRDTEAEVDYRSIERPKERNSPVDSDVEPESDIEIDQLNSDVTRRNAALIQRTRDHPSDVQAWMDLVEHQEAMLLLGRVSAELNSSDRRNLADIRISTYEEAIRKASNDSDSQIKLHLGLMAEASRSWDEGKLTNKWSEILSKHSSNPELWIKYLDFVQSSFSSFKHDKCRIAFHKSLKALQSSSDEVPPKTYLHIMVRLTSMIRGSGYQELALAIWQGLLEFHLLAPEANKDVSRNDRVRLFGEFWDSEVSRIGEAEAKGWRNLDIEDTPSANTAESSLMDARPNVPIFEDFRARELEHMEKLRYPGRTTDEVGEDDPFHLILFSDIEEYLHVLPQDTPGTLILDAFLCFLGMPPFPVLGSGQHDWWSDPFLQTRTIHPGSYSGETKSFTETLSTFMDCPPNFQMTLELLFDHGFPHDLMQANLTITDLQFIRRVLKCVATQTTHSEDVGEYLLAFELNYFPDESPKTAKLLLKAQSTSFRLYNAYAVLESRRGNHEKADQVYGAALSMQKSTTPFTTPGSLPLFHSWVWEALQHKSKEDTLWRLVSPLGDIPKTHQTGIPNQTSILRIRTALTEANDRALLARDFPSAIQSTSLIALLAYLTNDCNPSAALAIHSKLSDWFLNHALSSFPPAELHAQSIAHFLTHHVTTAPIVKPALLRNALEPLLSKFPDNTILLSLYAANEARFSIDDRVRGVMSRNMLSSDKMRTSISASLFAIHYEMQRGEISGSTSHSVRALFKKAEEDIAAHCPGVWKSHVLFELREAEKEKAKRLLASDKDNRKDKRARRDDEKEDRRREERLKECYRRVKETFFKGLLCLPWEKEYMMLGFTRLGGVLGREELRRVYNVMVEKELRVYIDVDTSVDGDDNGK